MRVTVPVIHHVTEGHDVGQIKTGIFRIELVDGSVHHRGHPTDGILRVRQESHRMYAGVVQHETIVGTVILEILGRVGHDPVALCQRTAGESHLLQVATQELVKVVLVVLAGVESVVVIRRADAEATIGRIGIQAIAVLVDIAECFGTVGVCHHVRAIGYDGDVIPNATVIHGDAPAGDAVVGIIGVHGRLIVLVGGLELGFLAIGDRQAHRPHLVFIHVAVCGLPGRKPHPRIGTGVEVIGKVVHELHGVSVGKLLFVDGSAARGDEIRALGISLLGMILLMRQIAVAVELQASTTVTVHRIRRPVDIVAELVIIFPVGLHVQIVAVARHILDDQVTTVDGTGGMRLLEFPIGHHIQWGTFTFKRRGGDYRTRRGEHGKRYARHRWFDDIAYLSYMHDQALPSTLLFQRRCECAVAMRLRIMAFTRLSAAFRRRWLIQALFMVRASNIIRRSTDVQCAMNRMNLLWTVPIPVELPCRGGTAGSGLVAGVGMGHVHDRRPYERTGPSAVDLILRFIADGPVIWEGWRRTAMAPPGLRLLWDRAHGPGAARGVRGAWRGGRPSAVGGAGQPAHQWFRDGVRVAGGGRQPEDRGRIPTHRVEDRRPYRAQGRRPLGILDAVHVRRPHRDRRGRDQLQEGGTRTSPWSSTTSADGSPGRTTDTARRCPACSSDSRPTSSAPPSGQSPATEPNGSTPA